MYKCIIIHFEKRQANKLNKFIKTFNYSNSYTGFNPNLLISFLAFFSPRLCLALDTISMGSPVTVEPGKPTVPGVPASSNSGMVSSESESVAEPIPTNSTLVGSELAALSSSVNSGMFTDLQKKHIIVIGILKR